MNQTPTCQKLTDYFTNGNLPTLLYIDNQDYNRIKLRRPLHSHQSVCEIQFVYQGNGSYVIEDRTYPITPGSILLYNQGLLHETLSSTDTEIGVYCIGMTNVTLKDLPYNHLVFSGDDYVKKAGNLYSLLKNLCAQMFQLSGLPGTADAASQLLCAAFVSLIYEISSHAASLTFNLKGNTIVNHVRRYLDDHFTENITLTNVAEYTGYSETYISHLFKKITGQTPMNYVIIRRIGMAQNLLISTQMTATEIATRVGYDNTNYFTTLFTKVVGVPPVKYRQSYSLESRGTMHQL